MSMNMRSVLLTRGFVTRFMDSTSRGAFSRFYSDKGRVLSEEEQAKENVYIQKWERERLEKQKQQAEKEKAEKDKNASDKVNCKKLISTVSSQDTREFMKHQFYKHASSCHVIVSLNRNLKDLTRDEFVCHACYQGH
ncbi:hypothetical protein Ahy_B09g099788 [Arachis hypogaea]|uniref:ATPase inhibitor n=1 Tax=Arachis hypogaea TaxID=3818 RepID=A0A444XUP4_ARAHY|nr:hypothetical protein Ahy_B09g099788 [Arachis hypogaea]